MTNRTNVIDTRLANHFHNDVEIGVSTPEPVFWRDNLEGLGPFAALGIGFPAIHPDTGAFIAVYCPQVIEDQTRDYDDETFGRYINLLISIIDLMIVNYDEDRVCWYAATCAGLDEFDSAGLDEIEAQFAVLAFRDELATL